MIGNIEKEKNGVRVLQVIRAAQGRDLCDNCGKRRLLKPIGSGDEIYFICRPCKQAFKAAIKKAQL